MDPDTKHSRLTLTLSLIGTGLVVALAVLVATSSTDAKAGGGAGFSYNVVTFDYNARGIVGAGRESVNCVAGVSEDIGGNGTSSPAEVTTLGSLGEAELDIDNHGSHGKIEAENGFDYAYTGTHRETTACSEGTVASSALSNCSETINSTTEVFGLIKGGVGNQTRITWTFSQGELAGAWLPNFTCVKTINFLSKKCKSPPIDLERLTRPAVKLRFLCEVPYTTSPPAGSGYDRFVGLSKISGFVKLARLKN